MFIKKNIVGVDVSDFEIKVLQLDENTSISAYGSVALEAGTVVEGVIVDTEVFAKKLTTVLESTTPTPLVTPYTSIQSSVSLPESKFFTYTVAIPNELQDQKIKAYVETEAEKVIPFNLRDLYWSMYVVKIRGIRYATFAGAPKSIVENYVHAFTLARVQPLFIGGGFFSLGRAVLPDEFGEDNFMIIDMGASSINVGFFDQDAVANLSVRIPFGGNHLTNTLANELGLDFATAEEQKKQIGLDDKTDKKSIVPAILRQALEVVSEDAIKAKNFFEEKTGQKITKVLLTGGSSQLKNIAPYFETKLDVPTSLANPFIKIKNPDVISKETQSVVFANVIGLAIRGQRKQTPSIDLFSMYRSDPKNNHAQSIPITEIRSWTDFEFFMRDKIQSSPTSIRSFLKYREANTNKSEKDKIRTTRVLIATCMFLTFALGVLLFAVTWAL